MTNANTVPSQKGSIHSFDSVKGEYRARRQDCHNLCRQYAKSPSTGNSKRLKDLFKHCGERVFIEAGFHCDYGQQINIGHDVYINQDCLIIDSPIEQGLITIGDHCLIGPHVQLLAVSHNIAPADRKANIAQPITLEENVWIGGGAILLGGIHIGKNSVVGAGSVVTRPVPDNTVVAGNPARVIRTIKDDDTNGDF